MRSMARRRAVEVSQAPGLSGTPTRGHCSRACTKASCARSSARPTSPTTRATTAVTLAASMRQTASTVRRTPSTSGVGVVGGGTRTLLHGARPAARRSGASRAGRTLDPVDRTLGGWIARSTRELTSSIERALFRSRVGSGLGGGGGLGTQLRLALLQLRGELRTEVLGREDLAQLEPEALLATDTRPLLHPLDGLVT